jgi:hypothetical protein
MHQVAWQTFVVFPERAWFATGWPGLARPPARRPAPHGSRAPAARRRAQAAEGAVRAGIAAGGGAALPAPVFNLRKRFEYTCALAGERRSVVAGRMECTMQVPPAAPRAPPGRHARRHGLCRAHQGCLNGRRERDRLESARREPSCFRAHVNVVRPCRKELWSGPWWHKARRASVLRRPPSHPGARAAGPGGQPGAAL